MRILNPETGRLSMRRAHYLGSHDGGMIYFGHPLCEKQTWPLIGKLTLLCVWCVPWWVGVYTIVEWAWRL